MKTNLNDANIQEQMKLYSNMFEISAGMFKKLAQNNVEYLKSMMDDSLRLLQPLHGEESTEYFARLQNVLNKTMEHNKALYQEATEIISDAKDQVEESLQQQHRVLDHSPINLFNLFSNLTPSTTEMLKLFQSAMLHKKAD